MHLIAQSILNNHPSFISLLRDVDGVWNVMAHSLKPDFVFRRNGRVHLNRRRGGGRQFSRLLAVGVCAISGSYAGYTMFRCSVKGTGYPLYSPVSPLLPLPVRHRVPSHFNWTLHVCLCVYIYIYIYLPDSDLVQVETCRRDISDGLLFIIYLQFDGLSTV